MIFRIEVSQIHESRGKVPFGWTGRSILGVILGKHAVNKRRDDGE